MRPPNWIFSLVSFLRSSVLANCTLRSVRLSAALRRASSGRLRSGRLAKPCREFLERLEKIRVRDVDVAQAGLERDAPNPLRLP